MKTLKSITTLIAFATILSTLLWSCSPVDIRTRTIKKEGLTKMNLEKGEKLMESARQKQGMDQLSKNNVYEADLSDKWKGMMGRMAKLWPNAKQQLNMKFAVGTFDSNVTFTDGKKNGNRAGLQSWSYYEQPKGESLEFKPKANKNFQFGLAAFQYFFELVDRLYKAPIKAYAGETSFNGQTYDLVLITWGELKAHKEADQYLAYINQSTGLMDYCTYTIRDPYMKMPGIGQMYGTIQFADLKVYNGVQIPMTQYIYAFGPKKNTKKYLHKLTVKSFKFDGFNIKTLYPKEGLQKIGDNKLAKN